MKHKNAFTLVELLVVIGIIAVLLGILLPTINRARAAANRVACRSNMKQLGAAFTMYLNDSRGKLPRINTLPSDPPPADNPPTAPELFGPYLGNNAQVWRCPNDVIRKIVAPVPTYFEFETSSYQYNPMLSAGYAGKKLQDTPQYQQNQSLALVTIFWEYEAFHGKSGQSGSSNYVFADGHVADLID